MNEHSDPTHELPVPVVLGAPTKRELRDLADSVAAATPDPAHLTAFCRDLAMRSRREHRFRTVLLAHGVADLKAAPPAADACDPVPHPAELAFVFAGQSSQRIGMGEQLARDFPVVRHVVERVSTQLAEVLPLPLSSVIAGTAGEPGALDRCQYAQPALLAVELGMVELLGSVGVTPHSVAGHSFGEYVAATAAGVWSVPDACTVVATRGRLLDELPPGNGMIAVEADEEQVTAALRGTGVTISAFHGHDSLAIAGPLDQLGEIAAGFAARGARTVRISVASAYHSAAVDPALAPLAETIAAVPARPAAIPFVGNATGTRCLPHEPTTPEHWTTHCRAPVRWSTVVETLRAKGTDTFLEIGPSGVLSGLVTRCLPSGGPAVAIPAMRAEPDEATTFLDALARLDARGHHVDWPAVFNGSSRLRR